MDGWIILELHSSLCIPDRTNPYILIINYNSFSWQTVPLCKYIMEEIIFDYLPDSVLLVINSEDGKGT